MSRCKVFGQLPCYGVCAGRCARVLKQHSTHSFRTTTLGRSDNFTRADTTNNIGTPSDGGSAWVQGLGTWGIASNAGYESSGANQNNVAVLEASIADATVQVTINGTPFDIGVVARYADANNYLLWAWTGAATGLRMFKNVAGVFTQLGSTVAYTMNAGDVMKFTVSGNTLNGYVNGVLKVGPQTDSAGSTNTKHGLRAALDSAARFNSFSVA